MTTDLIGVLIVAALIALFVWAGLKTPDEFIDALEDGTIALVRNAATFGRWLWSHHPGRRGIRRGRGRRGIKRVRAGASA